MAGGRVYKNILPRIERETNNVDAANETTGFSTSDPAALRTKTGGRSDGVNVRRRIIWRRRSCIRAPKRQPGRYTGFACDFALLLN
jgi:hypothetical protein